MSAHARFSPSAAHRWMVCPGSVALTRSIPNTSSVYADEGTAAHILASRALEYNKPAAFFIGEQIQSRVDAPVFTVDEDMAMHVQCYLDNVNASIGDGTLLIEQKVEFSDAVGVPDQFGTADVIILSRDGEHFEMIDLKYGQGHQVYAKRNEQLMSYGLGVLETFGVVMGDVKRVTLTIHQPRIDHLDSWDCTVDDLHEHGRRMQIAAKAALEGCTVMDATGEVPDALLVPDKEACNWCPAKPNCKALREFVSQTVYNEFTALDEPETLAVVGSPPVPGLERLGTTYGVLDMIEGWCRSVRGEVERLVMGGMTVIGPDGEPMKVVEGKKGNRAWTDKEKAEAALAGILPPEKFYKPRDIVTPSVADKLLNGARKVKDPRWERFTDLIAQAPGKPKVTLGSDPAPPYVGSADAGEFANMDGPEA
jgi:hypothetical protein